MKCVHGLELCPVDELYSTKYCRICWVSANVPSEPLVLSPVARWIAKSKYRRPEDIGLGDTVARLLSRFGGEVFKKVYKRITGYDCGCSNHQAALNAMFPYPRAETDQV